MKNGQKKKHRDKKKKKKKGITGGKHMARPPPQNQRDEGWNHGGGARKKGQNPGEAPKSPGVGVVVKQRGAGAGGVEKKSSTREEVEGPAKQLKGRSTPTKKAKPGPHQKRSGGFPKQGAHGPAWSGG